MAPDIKASLKEAKNAIKENNFEQVSKHCKIVLKHDRNNYQALVMFARACQELQKFEDSKKALMLASTVEPETPVAWQGLAALMDSQAQLSTPQEAVTVYSKLVKLIPDGPKHESFLLKLAKAQETAGSSLAAAETLLELHSLVPDEQKNNKLEISQNIVNLVAPLQNSLSDEWAQKLIDILKNMLNESVLGYNENNYKLYIMLVHRSGALRDTFVAAKRMYDVFTTAYPLEWIARVFVEDHLPWRPTTDTVLWSECEPLVLKLMEIYPGTLWGNLAMGLNHMSKGCLADATLCYSNACERSKNQFSNTAGVPIIWWRLLLEAHCQSKEWPSVESVSGIVIALLTAEVPAQWPSSEDETNVVDKLQQLRAEALMELGHERHYRTALSILKTLPESNDRTVAFIKCLLHVDPSSAKTELTKYEETLDRGVHKYLLSKYLFLNNKLSEAQDILLELVERGAARAEALILLGQIYQELGDSSKALSCLLKAAKLDHTQGKSFLYLGHHYKRIGDKQKACKCYQKAHNLSPNGEEEGCSLSDIYRELGEHEKNFALLSAATKTSCGGSWAWLRMGLHYLSTRDSQSAILALQRCLQLQHNNIQALESLGDAYFARGSYLSAQKVYGRVLELNPTALFPRCQIAKIHLCVGELHTSVQLYNLVLEDCNDDAHIRSVALLGMAKAHFMLANMYRTTNHFENTLNHCRLAIKALDEARVLQPNTIGVWKLLGDCSSLLHCLPYYLSKAGIELPARLIQVQVSSDDMITVTMPQVLHLASKCYGAAIQLNKDDSSLWHDLGMSFYHRALHLNSLSNKSGEDASDLMHKAINSLKKSLSLDPQCSDAWNSLGLVCINEVIDNKSLAQHCFIRSVQLKPSANNWTHLGAFYLICFESQLAYQAFRQAQAIDPHYVTCWTGQALVAESVDHYDAADLFRHCCTIGIQPEACIGFGHHVLQSSKDVSAPIKASAADAMLFYSREHDRDVIGVNMAGVCLEECGMKNTACDLYSSAITHLIEHTATPDDNKLMDMLRCNYGRALINVGKFEDAAQNLSAISEPDIQSECLFALACLKASDFETGYSKYMSALHWLAQDHSHKANVLVALACLQYKFKKLHETKTLLFESCNEGGGCLAGILALGALGLIEGDVNLITAALNELTPYKDKIEAAHHVAFLEAARSVVSGDAKEAKNIISRAILRHPQLAPLWRHLSWVLLNTSATGNKDTTGVVNAAAAASALSQARGDRATVSGDTISHMDGVMRVLAHLQTGSITKALKQAQKSLLMYPGEGNAWGALVAALSSTAQGKGDADRTSIAASMVNVWAPKCSRRVSSWMKKLVSVSA